MERYIVNDVFNHTWHLTHDEFNHFSQVGIALKMHLNDGAIIRNKNWMLLKETICGYLD
jgi:hypothetical protein